MLSSALVALFGHDWGIGANAQALAALGVALISIGISIARAIKHHSLNAVAAAKYGVQLTTALSTAADPGLSNTDVTAALNTIQSGDTGSAPEAAPAVGD
jgi:hypothetical protein